jgi:hypothetical protein
VVEAFGIALFGLDRMAEGVAEVEQCAFAMFERVAFRDPRLVQAAARDRLGEQGIVAGQQAGRVAIEPREERRIDDRAVLDDFRQAGAQFARRQRAQYPRYRR